MCTKPPDYRFRVALHDTDAAGILFFAHLFRYAHDAYETWMESRGFSLAKMIRDADLALPLVHAEADYQRPLRHGDRVEVLVDVAVIGTGSFGIDYRFQSAGGELAASARTAHACIDPRTGAPCRLPVDLHRALSNAMSGSRMRPPQEPAGE